MVYNRDILDRHPKKGTRVSHALGQGHVPTVCLCSRRCSPLPTQKESISRCPKQKQANMKETGEKAMPRCQRESREMKEMRRVDIGGE